jgi:hypothetical protein
VLTICPILWVGLYFPLEKRKIKENKIKKYGDSLIDNWSIVHCWYVASDDE